MFLNKKTNKIYWMFANLTRDILCRGKSHAHASYLTRARLIYTPTVQVHMISQDPFSFLHLRRSKFGTWSIGFERHVCRKIEN
jgi:hypothetical protein